MTMEQWNWECKKRKKIKRIYIGVQNARIVTQDDDATKCNN